MIFLLNILKTLFCVYKLMYVFIILGGGLEKNSYKIKDEN